MPPVKRGDNGYVLICLSCNQSPTTVPSEILLLRPAATRCLSLAKTVAFSKQEVDIIVPQ